MPRHQITGREVEEYLSKQWLHVAASHGKGSSKELNATASQALWQFTVTDHGKETYVGNDPEAAVKAYNEAP